MSCCATSWIMPEARPYCATAPESVRSVFTSTRVPSGEGSRWKSTFALAPPRPFESLPCAFTRALKPASSMSVNFTWPAKVRATGPRRTETLPLYVSLSSTPVSSAPGMQGAMRGISIKVFHASLGGSGTSKLLLISMACLEDRELLEDPACCGDKRFILIEPADQLNADGQPVRSAMGRKRDRGCMQRRPEFLKSGIARRLQTLGRFARDHGRKQHIGFAEDFGNKIAAFLEALKRFNVSRVGNRQAGFDLTSKAWTEEGAICVPFMGHGTRALDGIDDGAGFDQCIEALGQRDIMEDRACRLKPARGILDGVLRFWERMVPKQRAAEADSRRCFA